MTRRNRIVRNVVANYLGQGWTALMAVAFLPVYIDHLGMEAYGLIGFFAVMQSVLAVFDLGVTPTLTREMARSGASMRTAQGTCDLVRSFEWICYGAAAILALCVWAMSDFLAHVWIKIEHLPPQAVVHSISIMAIVFAARFVEGIYRGALIGLDRQTRYNVLNAGLATVRYAGAVLVLTYTSATIEAFFIWQAAMSVLTLSALAFATYQCLPRPERRARFSREMLRPVLGFSAGMTAVSGLSIAMVNVDKLILSKLLPLDQFGHYALASVAASVLYTLVVPITQGAYPRMVGQLSTGDKRGLAASYHASSQLVTTIVAPAALCLGFFSSEILYVWSGDRLLGQTTSPVLSVLAFAAFANCLGYLGHNLQVVHGSTRPLIVTSGAGLACALGVLPWAASTYGMLGAGYAWLAICSLQAIATLMIAHIRVLPREGGNWLTQDVLIPLSGALTVVSLAYVLRLGIKLDRVGLGVFLLILGGIAVCTSALLAPQLRSAARATVTSWKSRYV